MSFIVVISVALGILYGIFYSDSFIVINLGFLSQSTLAILLLSVGLDIGSNKSALSGIKDKIYSVLIVTLSVIFGSLFGGIITASLFKMPWNEGLAISAGFGWYSLSGVILTNIGNAELGSIAFLSNVFRELITFIFVPIIAVRLNYLSAIGPAGATSMDTTLPIISNNTDSNTAIIAFINGVILSALVPILVPLLYTVM
ncbi:MAG: lysine exporter LysO family protein [Clostridiales bacterium]|nr:lysine exporter LysO family protein [Clostridiales bacterium]